MHEEKGKRKEESIPNELIILQMAENNVIFNGLYLLFLVYVIFSVVYSFFAKQYSYFFVPVLIFLFLALLSFFAQKCKKCIFLYFVIFYFSLITINAFCEIRLLHAICYLQGIFLPLLAIFYIKDKHKKNYKANVYRTFLASYLMVISWISIICFLVFQWQIFKENPGLIFEPFKYLGMVILSLQHPAVPVFITQCVLVDVLEKLENFDNLKSTWEQTSGQKYKE